MASVGVKSSKFDLHEPELRRKLLAAGIVVEDIKKEGMTMLRIEPDRSDAVAYALGMLDELGIDCDQNLICTRDFPINELRADGSIVVPPGGLQSANTIEEAIKIAERQRAAIEQAKLAESPRPDDE